MGAAGHRRGLRVHADPEAARALSQPAHAGHRADGRTDRAERRPRRGAGLVPDGQRAAEADRKLRRPGRGHRGSGDRQGGRPGHAVPVARDRDRGLQHLDRRLRHRLQLYLHEHDLVGRPDLAAADGDEPAGAVRADVRRLGHGGAAAGAHAGEPQHPRRRVPDRRTRSAPGWARATGRCSPTISTTSARSSGASATPRSRPAAIRSRSPRRSARPRPSTSTWRCCST